jgi:hypothetical protein
MGCGDMKNRTGINFKEHNLSITKTPSFSKYDLKSPKSDFIYRVIFINIDGVMIVKGDFGNWIFCREFHPSKKEGVSDSYWVEKLKISSTQDPYNFDSEGTEKSIKEMLYEGGLEDYGYEGEELERMKIYLEECLSCVTDSEWEYTYFAYYDKPDFLDAERVILCKSLDPSLLAVFDAFDEICSRMEE